MFVFVFVLGLAAATSRGSMYSVCPEPLTSRTVPLTRCFCLAMTWLGRRLGLGVGLGLGLG